VPCTAVSRRAVHSSLVRSCLSMLHRGQAATRFPSSVGPPRGLTSFTSPHPRHFTPGVYG
jgi:hypothetical protein